MTEVLGPARELEMLVNRVAAPMKSQRRRWAGMPSLSRELAERRDAALTRAQDAVKSDRFRALTLDTAAWLLGGCGRTHGTISSATGATSRVDFVAC
jgi:triphosphatase